MSDAEEWTPRRSQRPRRVDQQKRTRTGCDRCRARRRKCDEAKPRCGRCVDADAECNYAIRLSFLDKNARALAPSASVATGAENSEHEVVQLQFVMDGVPGAKPAKAATESSTSRQDVDRSRNQPTPTLNSSTGEKTVENESHREAQDLPLLDVELAIAAPSPDNVMTEGSQATSSAISELEPLSKQFLTETTAGHLKHYIDRVVPWLDVIDLGQTFGLLVPRLAMGSPLVFDAVMRISAVSSGSGVEGKEFYTDGTTDLNILSIQPRQVPGFTALQYTSRFVLLKAQLFLVSVPDTWEHMFVSGGLLPNFTTYDFKDVDCQRVWLGIITLMLRLELAYSLMHETAPTVRSNVFRDALAASEVLIHGTERFQVTLNASIRCLALLVDVMTLTLPEPDQEDAVIPNAVPSPVARAERWQQLLSDLQAWHAKRPSGLQELGVLEGDTASFPTVLFATSAGVFANIIYHIAMFLLLRHRPRTIRPAHEPHSSVDAAHMSPLWQARRVCGIAISSNPEHTRCWDPCMIAAFTLAARTMTHPDQQATLLACLLRVKISGWRIDSLVKNLRSEWGNVEAG